MEVLTCNWPGKSGTTYTYGIYKMSGTWNPVAGNYIFAKETSPGLWKALYVGETVNFSSRLTQNHEEWAKAIALGATHVHARVTSTDKSVRLAEESDLILSLNPPLNQKVSFGLNPFLTK